jgi:hypothetical protein
MISLHDTEGQSTQYNRIGLNQLVYTTQQVRTTKHSILYAQDSMLSLPSRLNCKTQQLRSMQHSRLGPNRSRLDASPA